MQISSRCAVIGFQQSAESFNAEDFSGIAFMPGVDDSTKALMNTTRVIIGQVFGKFTKMPIIVCG
jgi:hypothetical protein